MLSGIPCTSKGEEPQQQQELPTLLDNNKDKEGDDVKPPEAGAEAGADISTEDVVKAFQQIKGATVTVIKKKKKKDQDKDKDKEKDKDKDKDKKRPRLSHSAHEEDAETTVGQLEIQTLCIAL